MGTFFDCSHTLSWSTCISNQDALWHTCQLLLFKRSYSFFFFFFFFWVFKDQKKKKKSLLFFFENSDDVLLITRVHIFVELLLARKTTAFHFDALIYSCSPLVSFSMPKSICISLKKSQNSCNRSGIWHAMVYTPISDFPMLAGMLWNVRKWSIAQVRFQVSKSQYFSMVASNSEGKVGNRDKHWKEMATQMSQSFDKRKKSISILFYLFHLTQGVSAFIFIFTWEIINRKSQ